MIHSGRRRLGPTAERRKRLLDEVNARPAAQRAEAVNAYLQTEMDETPASRCSANARLAN
jgi:hypothetical protein